MKKNVLFGVILFLMLLTNACKNNDNTQKTPQNPTASVNPFDHISFGEIDADEIPPRHPFTKPNYRIELVAH